MTPRLKSLELHGYKTFASRTLFEFPGDVTAIVGPNGSGKSNIADLLRWVLGEQSYSLLRGRKTEDMIFSGSEQRPRASMASASITFSNEDGWLPIDFNEVSITRRAYRDGQNEYLLNGQKVRLKEISELLGKSGLAERTYTIIGQGLVDAALSLKPEERRRFFEEAAGIGLYRARREESLNRLDATRRNLERVLDILSELEPRLGSLEKQARRALEYERIRAELRLMLRDWYGYHWHRNQQELIHAREVLKAQESRLTIARQRQLEVEESLGELRSNVLELRNALNEWHARSAELHTLWEKTSRTLAVMDERQAAILQSHQNLQRDLARLRDEEKMRSDRSQTFAEERDRLEDELKEAQTQVSEVRQKLRDRLAERGHIEQALRDTRRSLTSIETAQMQRKAHQNELTNRLNSLHKSKVELVSACAEDAEALQRVRAKLEMLLAERQTAEGLQKTAELNLQEAHRQITAAEGRRKQLQDERARLETERSRLTARMEVLEQAERSLNGLTNGAKFLLQEARQGRLKGKYSAVSSQLVVPVEYEAAIAAALGEFFDGVLYENGTDIEAALAALSIGEKGRTLMLPIQHEYPSETLPEIEDPGCLGVASQLVKTPEALWPVVHLLLGQVLIVRDREVAARLIRRMPVSARMVTLQGEVFYGSGAISAGKDSRASAIGRPRQKQELREGISEAGDRLKQFQDRWQEIENELERLRSASKDREAALRQAGQVVSKASQAHQQAALEVEQVRQRHDFHSKQLAGMDGQVERVEKEIHEGLVEVERNSQRIITLSEQIRTHNHALGALPVDELQMQEVHWNTAAAVAGRALKEAERRIVEHREAVVSIRKQVEDVGQRLSSAAQNLTELDSEKAKLKQEEDVLSREIAALRAQIEPAEEQVEIAEKAYSEQQEVLAAAQQGVAAADRHVSQAQLDMARVREALELLRRRVEDDFGLVSFEYQPENDGLVPLPLEGMVEQLPDLAELPAGVEENINRQRALLRRMGPVNPEVQNEYQSVKERFDFLTNQVADLRKADVNLREVITQLDELMRKEFRKTFDAVAAEFRLLFTRLFGGGSARLVLSDSENLTETGIDIEARLPGRREQGLSLLSGGERSLTAVALIFSLLKVSPTPFCVLDEVDAMLDEANVGRFRDLLLELSVNTQFIIVTHNRNTVQAANVIYGITMGRDSVSQIISLRLDEISDEMVK